MFQSLTATSRIIRSCLSRGSASRRLLSSSPAASTSHSLYTWGTNNNGSLLQDSSVKLEWEPKLVENLPFSVQSIACGPTDTAVVTDEGDIYVSGTNKSGQLGMNHTKPVSELTKVPDLPPSAKIAIGANNSAIITKEGDLYTCGFGGSLVSGLGCLGHGNSESYLQPKLVQSLVEDGCYAKDVVIGESHMTVLTTEGEILTTGASSYGRLGNGETSVDSLYLEPVEILQNASQIAGGKSFTLALSDGVVYGWGRNHKGQLGTGFGMAVDMYSMEEVPCPIDADELMNRTVTKIAAGANHAACLTSSGELFWWGMSLHLEPVRVSEVLHTKIIDIACGNDYSMALSEDNHIYVWGRGKTGVLGVGPDTKILHQAQMIKTMVDEKIVGMSAGWTHAACLVI